MCRCRSSATKVRAVGERDGDESTDEEYTPVQPITDVTTGGKTVKCLIDSGAGVNVIDTCTFNELGNIHISPISKTIYGYISAEPLSVVGMFEANITSRVTSKCSFALFCVVNGQMGI